MTQTRAHIFITHMRTHKRFPSTAGDGQLLRLGGKIHITLPMPHTQLLATGRCWHEDEGEICCSVASSSSESRAVRYARCRRRKAYFEVQGVGRHPPTQGQDITPPKGSWGGGPPTTPPPQPPPPLGRRGVSKLERSLVGKDVDRRLRVRSTRHHSYLRGGRREGHAPRQLNTTQAVSVEMDRNPDKGECVQAL